MPSHDRWLKNVSQADVARVAREKRERQNSIPRGETRHTIDLTPSPSPTIPNHPQPSPSQSLTVAPIKDFNRRANSIERQALPSGSFPGASKKIYDAIYARTRGAIQPCLEVQVKKRSLMEWSGIKNIKTIETHLRHLVAVGLMTRRGENGDPAGYWYGVRLPEDASIDSVKDLETSQPSPTIPNHPQPSPTIPNPNQKRGMGRAQKMVMVGEGNLVENKGDSGFPNTSFKTTTNTDDEALVPLIEFFRELTRKLTGKQMSAADAERWKELAELLGTEAERAASRTSISNLPAFLTEHLRRRLAREEKADRKVKPDLVGKGEQTPAPQPMADNERAEITSMITEMVTSGSYTIDQAEAQFGGGLRPEDWSAIKSAIAETQKPES